MLKCLKVKGPAERFLVVFVVLASLTFYSCASPPAPPRLDASSSAIGISVSTNSAIAPVIREVYFIRVEKDEDLLTSKEILPSNFSRHDRFYLLNAKPGRYAAVACLSIRQLRAFLVVDLTSQWEIFFSKDIIRSTLTSVGPGQVGFMGKYVVAVAPWKEDHEEAWTHYFSVIQSHAPSGSILASMSESELSKNWFLGASHREGDHGEAAERQFLLNAIEDLKDVNWSETIKQRLNSLPPGQ